MKRYIFVAICSMLVILWVAFIWSNSMQTGEDSGEVSSDVTDIINEVVEPVLGEPVSEHTVRKSAHFLEYMLLGLLASLDVLAVSYALSRRSELFISLLMPLSSVLGFAVAVIDEFLIQAATDGRGPSWRDVGIDSAGALTGAIICIAVFLFACRIAGKGKNKVNSQI